MKRFITRSLVKTIAALVVSLIAGCATGQKAGDQGRISKGASPPPSEAATDSSPAGETTVVWISIDGFRHDYLARIQPTTLGRLAREGAWTTQETPIFPSLTFPNHIAQATGTTVDQHGVPLNGWLDEASGEKFNFPNDSGLIRCEPIWKTAKRQGVRVAILHWPMSYAQTGPFKSDYFLDRFDGEQSDAQRLAQVSQTLENDHAGKPIRLVMTYVAHLDTIGHRFGPDSPEVGEALRQLDSEIDAFLKRTIAWFNDTHKASDDLCVLITTDHGMEPVHTRVNLDRLIGAELMTGATVIANGPVASVYLSGLSADEKPPRASAILKKLKQYEYLQAWPASSVPAKLHFSDPTRLGEVIVLLSSGYDFTTQRNAATQPTVQAGPLGAHGYDPAICPNMQGAAIVWRYRHPLADRDLGPVNNTQWHATVAKLLNIQPAPGADYRAINLDLMTLQK